MSPMATAVAPQERQLGIRALRLSMNYSEWRSVGSAGVITVLAAAAGSVVSADCSSSSAQALRFVFSSTWQCSPKNISLIFFHFADWLRRFIYLNPTFYGKFPLENGGTSDLDVAGVGEFIVKVGEPGEGLYIIFKGKVEILRTVEPSLESGSAAFLSKGEHFGQACLGPEKPGHTHNIIAHSEVSCIVIPHEQAQLLSPASTWRHEPGELAPVERLLQLKCIKDDLFQSYSMPEAPTFWANMYGGHLVGLALGAACKTVDPSLGVHSLHSYFLRSGNPNIPIDFKVERIRDGQTFATRQVQAMQKGKICFTMYASFQRAESGLEFQYSMPTTTGPSELPTYEDLLGPLCDDKRLSRHNQQASSSSLKMSQTLDLRYVDRRSPANLEPQEPRQRVWMRSKGKLSDDPVLHRCAASYAFDWSFLETALGPHNKLVNRYPIVGLSLDHSTWFHRPFQADEYVLVVV